MSLLNENRHFEHGSLSFDIFEDLTEEQFGCDYRYGNDVPLDLCTTLTVTHDKTVLFSRPYTTAPTVHISGERNDTSETRYITSYSVWVLSADEAGFTVRGSCRTSQPRQWCKVYLKWISYPWEEFANHFINTENAYHIFYDTLSTRFIPNIRPAMHTIQICITRDGPFIGLKKVNNREP